MVAHACCLTTGEEETGVSVILSSHVNLGHPVLLETLGRTSTYQGAEDREGCGWIPTRACKWPFFLLYTVVGPPGPQLSQRTFCHVWGHV